MCAEGVGGGSEFGFVLRKVCCVGGRGVDGVLWAKGVGRGMQRSGLRSLGAWRSGCRSFCGYAFGLNVGLHGFVGVGWLP